MSEIMKVQLRVMTVCIVMLISSRPCLAEQNRFHVVMEVDLSKDVGQNFGTLFEACDSDNEPIVGAGFLGVYNTRDRSDRYVVHFFLRTGDRKPVIESLPRPTMDCGVYLNDFAGRLTARSVYGGSDTTPRVWDPLAKKWRREANDAVVGMLLAGKLLEFRTNDVHFDGKPILTWKGPGTLQPFYYANGRLVARQYFPEAEKRNGRLVAFSWTPDSKELIDPAKGLIQELSTQRPFVNYACGQLGEDVLITTNLGDVYRLTPNGWQALRQSDGKSYQVYAALNTYDRLWLGQYPTGHLFEYHDGKLTHLDGQPPRMPKVSPIARELQTLTIYGGDIYAGVWPWGEVWRYRAGPKRWEFVQRMFSHPKPTDTTIHPYENETAAVDPIPNLWGQRITSMVPLGDSLYISTSAKSNQPFDPKFKFLADDRWKEYGMVYRYHLPGHLAAPIKWKAGPTRLEFIAEKGKMRVLQDGEEVAHTSWKSEIPAQLTRVKLKWGSGLYGAFAGRIVRSHAIHNGLSDKQ